MVAPAREPDIVQLKSRFHFKEYPIGKMEQNPSRQARPAQPQPKISKLEQFRETAV
jgi:hypothetical protein